jgi:nitric oxide reductase NorD protein
MSPESAPAAALERLLRGRDALREPFHAAMQYVLKQAGSEAAADWSRALLSLLEANAGSGCVLAFLTLSARVPAGRVAALPSLATAAIAVCHRAGGRAAQACVEATSRADDRPGAWPPGAGWWHGFTRLAEQAPECVVPLAERAETVLRATGPAGFTAFVIAGLKFGDRDKVRRRAFFRLEDPAAQRELQRQSGVMTFAAQERTLDLLVRGVWGRGLMLRPMPEVAGYPPPRRSSFSQGVILLPGNFAGVPRAQAKALFRAAALHAGAHLAFTPVRFAVGTLKPLQVALIGLIEDARVEALAIQRFPGLRRLWQPFHVALPTSNAAPTLMARLARALFDSGYADPHGFVAKGRALFDACASDLTDTALSRRIGGLLGNDLGQMRSQFDPRSYVVDPAYRDDNLGLWDFGDMPDPPAAVVELQIQTARPRHGGADRQAGRGTDNPVGSRRVRPHATDHGVVLARYPEWDQEASVERPEWTCVREVPAVLGDVASLESTLARLPDLRRRINRLVRAARPGRPVRLRRRPDGPDLDLDAVIEAATARAMGREPDDRVYRITALRRRDVATAILLDVSESMRRRFGGGTLLDLERIAVALLADALTGLGDPFALLAFASDGREAVRLTRVKDFGEPYGPTARARLAGLRAGLSTRLGAAIRHAGAEMDRIHSFRRLVLVLSDAEPSDIDVTDPRDLVEDARRARLTLRSRGIDTFGVTLAEDTEAASVSARIFGAGGFASMRRLEDLPARLSDLYFRLSRR